MYTLNYLEKNLIEVSKTKGRIDIGVSVDHAKLDKILKHHDYVEYIAAHTHIGGTQGISYPSQLDIESFLRDDEIRTMVVANTDEGMGEVKGYFFLRKTNKTPRYKESNKIIGKMKKKIKDSRWVYGLNIRRGEYTTALSYVVKQHHLKYKIVPAQGYILDNRRQEGRFVKKSDLESKVVGTFLFMVSILVILFLWGNSITGNVIINRGTQYRMPILSFFVVIGIGAIYYFLRKN